MNVLLPWSLLGLIFLNIQSFTVHAQYYFNSQIYTQYTNENGLNQNSVKAIYKDDYGFIWLATENGLSRFDGKNFKHYNRSNTGISSSRMVSIVKGINNKVYAFNDAYTFFLIHNGKAYRDTLNSSKTQNISNYFLSDSSIKYTFSPLQWNKFNFYDSLAFILNDDVTLKMNYDKGFSWYEKGQLKHFFPYQFTNDYNNIFSIENSLYFLKPQPLFTGNAELVSKNGIVTKPIIGDIKKQQIKNYKDFFIGQNYANNQVFLYIDKCLYLLNQFHDSALHTTLVLANFDCAENRIVSAFYDESTNKLFLGSLFDGLYLFEPQYFKLYQFSKLSTLNNVYQQIALNEHSVLTASGLMVSTEGSVKLFLEKQTKEKPTFNRNILRLWNGNILTYDGVNLKVTTESGTLLKSIEIPNINAIAADSNGMVFLASRSFYFFKVHLEQNKVDTVFHEKKMGLIYSIDWADKNTLLISSENGLFRYDLLTQKITANNALKGKIVRGAYVRSPQEIYYNTYESGLYVEYQDSTFEIPTNKVNHMKINHMVLEDSLGFFWISTNNGVYKVLRQDIINYISKGKEPPFFNYYNKEVGITHSEFNGGSSRTGVKLANGYFSYSNLRGVVMFNPVHVVDELPNHPVILDHVDIDGQYIEVNDNIVNLTSPNFNRITLTIATAYFGNPENLSFEYHLENNNNPSKKWFSFQGESISFTSFPPGENIVTIRKRNGFGANNYSFCHIKINVPKYWYESELFIVLLLFVGAIFFIVIVKLRERYWKRRNEQLEQAVYKRTQELNEIIAVLGDSEQKISEQLIFQKKMNRNIAHDVNTPLKYLTYSMKHIVDQLKNNQHVDVEEVEGIYISCNRIYQYVKSLTEYLQVRYKVDKNDFSKFSLKQLIAQKFDVHAQTANSKNVTLVNIISSDIEIYSHEKLFSIIVHNLIDNALKHTDNGHLIVTAEVNEHREIRVMFKDSGLGMMVQDMEQYNYYFNTTDLLPKDIYTGFGFEIIKDLTHLLNIHISLSANIPQGLIVTLKIPN